MSAMPLIEADGSEFQVGLGVAYNRPGVIFRGAFGAGYQDHQFLHNASFAKAEWDAGRLQGGAVVYQVILGNQSAAAQAAYLWSLIGPTVPDWLTGIYIDAERWPGKSYEIRGDHSAVFNDAYARHAHKMGSWDGCKGYGNWGDLTAIWTHRDPRCEFVEARYASDIPRRTGKIGQQYTDGSGRYPVPKIGGQALPTSTAPWGHCDHNVFPDIANADAWRKAWGRKTWTQLHPPKPTPHPVVTPPPPSHHPAAPAYDPTAHPHAMVSPDGAWLYCATNDGHIEARHNHRLDRSI